MNILVCISKTPDTTTRIKFTGDHKNLDTQGVQWIINPYDDHALASALDLKAQHGGKVTVIHVGEASSDPVIRKALAIGADEAIRINAQPHDAFFVAKQISEVIKDKEFDFIYTGQESIDYNGSLVGDLLGEFLNLPSVGYVKSIEIQDTEVHFTRSIEGGSEKLKTTLPVVIGSTKELAEPKIPNMRGIMQARSKKLDVAEPADVPVHTEYQTYEPPQEKGECEMIDPEEAEKLIEKLHHEAKVI